MEDVRKLSFGSRGKVNSVKADESENSFGRHIRTIYAKQDSFSANCDMIVQMHREVVGRLIEMSEITSEYLVSQGICPTCYNRAHDYCITGDESKQTIYENELYETCVIGKTDRRILWRNNMKTLYIIGGTMGVGKTTVCQQLKQVLPNSVFLDGDWCWDAHPFQVTEETKAMVTDNICHLLNNFLHCSAYENVIFCWVMHQQAIIDSIVEKLDTFSDCG